MEILPWYLLGTFGLPLFGLVLLLVSAMISAVIILRRRQGHMVEANYPKVLSLIGVSLIVVPSALFLLGSISLIANSEAS